MFSLFLVAFIPINCKVLHKLGVHSELDNEARFYSLSIRKDLHMHQVFLTVKAKQRMTESYGEGKKNRRLPPYSSFLIVTGRNPIFASKTPHTHSN